MRLISKILVVALSTSAFVNAVSAQTPSPIRTYADSKACLERIQVGGRPLAENVHFKEGAGYDPSRPGVVNVMTHSDLKTNPAFAPVRSAIQACIPGWTP